MQNPAGVLVSFAAALTWAGTAVILRSLSARMDAFLVNGIRAVIALLFMAPLVLINGTEGYAHLTPTHVVFLISSVLIGGVAGNTLNLFSLRRLGVGGSFPIANTSPLFTLLFSALLLQEPMRWVLVPGTLLVLAGVYLIAVPRGRQVEPDVDGVPRGERILGVLLALGAAILWGLNAVVLSLGLRDVGGVLGNSVRVPFVGLVSLAIATARGQLHQVRALDRRTWLLLWAGGILGWGISSTLYALSVDLAGPNLAMIIGATAPLFALPMSILLLGERPTYRTFVGTVLAVLGIVLVV